ncbi:MAG: hypothetical protein Q7U08_06355 [Flavobacteriaceae bacterium]|jgi:hypothetical protein|nr:hypothetical protein [Flavobacteriaceae bacterium]
MGFDDFYQPKKKYRKHDSRYSNDNYSYNKNIWWISIAKKILNNPKLRIFIIVVILLFIILLITLISLLFPLITKIYDYISTHGIEGAVSYITDFLNKIWKGSL